MQAEAVKDAKMKDMIRENKKGWTSSSQESINSQGHRKHQGDGRRKQS
jgi:hypothetical protein